MKTKFDSTYTFASITSKLGISTFIYRLELIKVKQSRAKQERKKERNQ